MQSLEFFQQLESKLFQNLRCYQKEGIQQVLEHIENGEKSILRQNFTGTGKSVEQNYLAINHLATQENNTVLFLTHKEELVQNLAEYFLKEKIYLSYIQAGKATLYNSRIFIASVDTLRNRLEKLKIKPTLILIEECHHGLATTWRKILDFYSDAIKVGFTATPERLDGASFNKIFNVMVEGKPYSWYIENHFLAPYQFVNPSHFIDIEVKKVKGDYDLLEQEKILDDDVIYSDAVDTWQQFTPGLKTVTFCTSIKHSEKVAEAYNEFSRGLYGRDIAIHLDGTTDKPLRKEAIARFRLPADNPDSLLVICNFNLISEGVNIPDCQVTQWLRKTASAIFYDQGNGRSNRYQPGKIQYIIDHVGNKLIHGYPDRIRNYDLVGRKEKEKQAKYHLICHNCKTVVHKDYRKLQGYAKWVDCPTCGCSVVVPTKKTRGVKRTEKKTDFDVEMILDSGENSHVVNLHALFRKYDYLNNKNFFDTLIKFDSIKLDELKIACQYRKLPEFNAYTAWSRKLSNILKV